MNHLSAGSASPCRLRVAVVAPIIAKGAGTSSAIRDTIRAVSSEAAWRVSVFVRANEYREIAAHRVEDAGELRRRPEFAAAHVALGRALGDSGNIEAAIAEFRAALALEPSNAEARRYLDMALAMLRR